jgi:biotin carboxyl carrier protein
MKYRFERAGKIVDIDVVESPDGYVLYGPDRRPQPVRLRARADGSQLAITPWGDVELVSARRGSEIFAHLGASRVSARVERSRPNGAGSLGGASAGEVRAPMAGKLLRLDVRVGDRVRAAQPLAVIEAMKMENEMTAPFDGVVVEVGAAAPSTLDKGALIVKLSPA